jgi:serine/threonine protein kinase
MTERDIFLAVLDLPDPAGRAAYLDGACGGDAALRGRVEALLRSHDTAGSFLGAPAVSSAEPDRAATGAFDAVPDAEPSRTGGGTPGPDSDDEALGFLDGSLVTRYSAAGGPDSDDEALGFLGPPHRPDSLGRIGRYEVLEVLGRGGFGIVFRAFDEVLQRVVAVKVLAPQMALTSPARKRFLREARSLAAVRHENVVQVYAVEEQPLPYLVMELIPGETLQQRLDRTGPLDVTEVLRIGRQVAAGLAAAHEQGLIHRDIKPANVLIEGGPQPRVKLTDFGLARAADDASISQSGVVAGTPMYMAPEQANAESLDHRADLFSLGSVLYVMCTGHPPFRASGTLAVLRRVVEDDPRPIREVIPEVPEWLCRVVEKLHAKDPAARFQTAREVADLLADCDQQLKAHAGLKDFARIPGGKPAARKTKRWKWAAAALLLPLVALGVYALTRSDRQPEPRVRGKTDPDSPGWAPSPFKPLPAEEVNAAIDKGVAFLKDCLDDHGRGGRDVVNTAVGPVSIQHLGATALAGLTLLGCDVPADDPAVQKVIARVRKEGPDETNTYVLSLSILFLDQLDDSKDRSLIQKLAIRLVAGQTIRGGWPYACPKVSFADQERLLKMLEDKAPLNRADLADRNRLRSRYRGVPVLTYKIGQKVSPGYPVKQVFDWNPGYDDSSNTQFAVLALWAARKSGIPVDKSLSMAEMRFRDLQNADGSWGYNKVHTSLWCDSMTCAALMGLAAGRGVSKLESPIEGKEPKARGLANDPQVLRGLAFLGKTVGKPGFKRLAKPTASGRNNRLFGSTAEEDIFLLWSLERMSVIYSLEKIDGKEWYPWAAKLLVDAQKRDGSWIELYGSAPNTCFALLVLKRVNLVKDLTSKLQKLEQSTLKKKN